MKLGKDLQRRIAKLREENKDPALPQKPTRTASFNANAGPSSSPSAAVPPPQPVPSPPPNSQGNRLSDSQQTVDESFMLLGQRVRTAFLPLPDSYFLHSHCTNAQERLQTMRIDIMRLCGARIVAVVLRKRSSRNFRTDMRLPPPERPRRRIPPILESDRRHARLPLPPRCVRYRTPCPRRATPTTVLAWPAARRQGA